VQLAGAVDGQADQEAVLAEECSPAVIQQGAVGLDGVRDPLAGLPVPFGQFGRAAEEVQAHHGRLATLPSHHHLGRAGVRLD
jgi:hypothetical protein